MSIYDIILAQDIVDYWEILAADEPPYVGESKWPAEKQIGVKIEYIKGAKGLPVVLSPSAYDVKAIPRQRIGFDKLEMEMPFFKESKKVSEVLRQQLNIIAQTNNQKLIDMITTRIFDDEMDLLRGARAQRERMRMMLLTTGGIDITANGENLSYDYHMPAGNKVTVTKSWSDPSALIVDDIRTWQDKIEDATGVRPTEAMCSRKTWNYFLINTQIKSSLFPMALNTSMAVSDNHVQQYLMQQLGLTVIVNTKRYQDEAHATHQFVPDDVLVLYPEGELGNTVFGTTPEESDLMTGSITNVSITDTGVAVTTIQVPDPVTVETKVTMVCLPTFPEIDKLIIADLTA